MNTCCLSRKPLALLLWLPHTVSLHLSLRNLSIVAWWHLAIFIFGVQLPARWLPLIFGRLVIDGLFSPFLICNSGYNLPLGFFSFLSFCFDCYCSETVSQHSPVWNLLCRLGWPQIPSNSLLWLLLRTGINIMAAVLHCVTFMYLFLFVIICKWYDVCMSIQGPCWKLNFGGHSFPSTFTFCPGIEFRMTVF